MTLNNTQSEYVSARDFVITEMIPVTHVQLLT